MGAITGEQTADIAVPPPRCFAIAADLEAAVGWQPALREVEIHERDAAGRPVVATLSLDAKVKAVASRCRLTYDEPGVIAWEQERGDVRSMRGRWTFTAIEAGATRATYALEVDPGRMLGLALRGPGVVDRVRGALIGGALDGLRGAAER